MQSTELLATSLMANVVTSLFNERLITYFTTAKENPALRKRLLKIVWIISIVLMLGITAGLIFGIHAATNSYKIGIFVSVVTWAIFFGVTALLFLSSKPILTIFGFLLGSSASEIGNSTGLITKVNEGVTNVSNQIGIITAGTEGKTDVFITQSVWAFIIIVTLLCLPAFFEKADAGELAEQGA